MTAAPVEIHHLVHDGTRGTTHGIVVPAWGANIIGFGFHPADLLWSIPFLEPADIAAIAEKPTSFGAPLLAPTPGRVGTGVPGAFRFDGRDYRMAQARHGFLRNLAWTVIHREPSSIVCALDVRPSESLGSFPFAFRAEHQVSVAEGRLHCRLTFRSTSASDQPISAGWHPYLYRDAGCRLRIPAASVWELDDSGEPVPTGRRVPVAGANDFRAARELAAHEPWDHTFTDLRDGQSWVESEIMGMGRDQKERRVTVRRTVEAAPDALPNIQLYTVPGRPAIAVEPFSSPPNALALLDAGHADANVRRLGPGEEIAFEMTLALTVEIS
jgi:galactose mutarotase-like enzyme